MQKRSSRARGSAAASSGDGEDVEMKPSASPRLKQTLSQTSEKTKEEDEGEQEEGRGAQPNLMQAASLALPSSSIMQQHKQAGQNQSNQPVDFESHGRVGGS
jgi:hypothetical protein